MGLLRLTLALPLNPLRMVGGGAHQALNTLCPSAWKGGEGVAASLLCGGPHQPVQGLCTFGASRHQLTRFVVGCFSSTEFSPRLRIAAKETVLVPAASTHRWTHVMARVKHRLVYKHPHKRTEKLGSRWSGHPRQRLRVSRPPGTHLHNVITPLKASEGCRVQYDATPP